MLGALHNYGQNRLALHEIKILLPLIKNNPQVPGQPWYKCNAALTLVEILWKSGKYEQALSKIKSIKKAGLSTDNQIVSLWQKLIFWTKLAGMSKPKKNIYAS